MHGRKLRVQWCGYVIIDFLTIGIRAGMEVRRQHVAERALTRPTPSTRTTSAAVKFGSSEKLRIVKPILSATASWTVAMTIRESPRHYATHPGCSWSIISIECTCMCGADQTTDAQFTQKLLGGKIVHVQLGLGFGIYSYGQTPKCHHMHDPVTIRDTKT